MRNLELAAIFNQVGDILEIQGANPFRIRAYRRAAATLEGLGDDVENLVRQNRLRDVPGIGADLAGKIREYVETGRMQFFEDLKRQVPVGLVRLVEIPGVGPRTARQIHDRFEIESIDDLEQLCRSGRLLDIPGFKKKSVANILRGIEIHRRRRAVRLLGRTLPIARRICRLLEPAAERVEVAGSLRRMKETVHDVDILAASTRPEQTIQAFLELPIVTEVLARGGTKASVRVDDDLQVDLRVVEPESWGAAMHYFTGSRTHNIRMRERALRMGLKLNEYGLFDEHDRRVAGRDEHEIFQRLGLPYIPPVLREDLGEIEAAERGALPRLVQESDIQGDLHMHTSWSDGKFAIAEMVELARRRGYKYVAITDHSKSLAIAHGLSDQDLRRHTQEVREVAARYSDIRVLAGTEVDIRQDGTLDYPDALLADLDFVVASVHSGLRQDRSTMTRRIIQAMQNPWVRVIGHPTGRRIGERDPSDLDFDAIMREAVRTRTCLEVNANFHRLDLNDSLCRKARDMGVHVIVNTDSHNEEDLLHLPYGVATAQRGWTEKERVLNTWPVEDMLQFKSKP